MLLKGKQLAELLGGNASEKQDPFAITPLPDLTSLREAGSASIDLRLGTWITTPRQTRIGSLNVNSRQDEPQILRSHYVRFGESFFLHPRNFILAATLEWLRLPGNLAGYVIGKSSWGRRGLVTATATGVHPGFAGCLTLELTNLGELPIELQPGLAICQIFLHTTSDDSPVDRSPFVGLRRPILGKVTPDSFALALGKRKQKT
jgi:dCTP deaminase